MIVSAKFRPNHLAKTTPNKLLFFSNNLLLLMFTMLASADYFTDLKRIDTTTLNLIK
jgi:hypothetical protein